MDNIPAPLRSTLSESLSDPANMVLGAAGVETPLLGALGRFVQNRAMDVIGGAALMPLFNWIDQTTGTPWASRGIQGTLALIGMLSTGDPFGAIAAPIAWGIQEYMKQRQRLIENKDPEAERGKKFGYVREGDKWYPAIQTSKERDEGYLGSNKTQITMQYGNQIKWRKGKLGEWMPYFEKGSYRMKNFHVSDEEVDKADGDGAAGLNYQKRVDPLRDFYYLSEDETTAYLRGVMGGTTYDRDHVYTDEEKAAIGAAQKKAFSDFGSNVHDDVGWSDYWAGSDATDAEKAGYANRGEYVDQLQDIRKSLEFMQSYRYSEGSSMESTDFGMNEFEGSRELRQTVNEHNYLGYTETQRLQFQSATYSGETRLDASIKNLSGRLSGTTAEELARSGTSSFANSAEMLWLNDEYYKQRNLLTKAQKAAGLSKGFDHIFADRVQDADTATKLYYYNKHSGAEMQYNKTANYAVPALQKGEGWGIYQDGTWEFGSLDTQAQLRSMIAKIEASGEEDHRGTEHYRNDDQRAYLAQKAYCRYLFSKINQLGGADYVADEGNKRAWVKGIIYPPNTGYLKLSPGWALDPMYSEADDGEDAAHNTQYGVSKINHGPDYVPPESFGQRGQAGNNLLNLQKLGVITPNVTTSADYIAGNFTTARDYYDTIGVTVDEEKHEESFDDVLHDAGLLGPKKQSGKAWVHTTAPPEPTPPVLEPTPVHEPVPVPEPPAPIAPINIPEPVPVVPEHVDVPDSPKRQTVPDEHPGATHVHAQPAFHAFVDHAPDATAPRQLPMSLLSRPLGGVKVI